MHIAQTRLHCQKCHEIFDGEIVNSAPFAVAIASMKALRCPNCGATELDFVLNEDLLRKRLGQRASPERMKSPL